MIYPESKRAQSQRLQFFSHFALVVIAKRKLLLLRRIYSTIYFWQVVSLKVVLLHNPIIPVLARRNTACENRRPCSPHHNCNRNGV